MDCAGVAPNLLLRALHRVPGVEVLPHSRHLHGEYFYLYQLILRILTIFIFISARQEGGVSQTPRQATQEARVRPPQEAGPCQRTRRPPWSRRARLVIYFLFNFSIFSFLIFF